MTVSSEFDRPAHESSSTMARFDRALLIAAILSPIVPFILLLDRFRSLFWFGDEIHLLSEIRHVGYWQWVSSNFAENFVPLFKLLWGGAAILFNGSYFAVVLLLWGTHVINCALLARILVKLGIHPIGVAFAVVTFGVSHTTHESLGWTVQWSAVLATSFFLLALDNLVAAMKAGTVTLVRGTLCTLSLFASTLCFSRGVLVCAVVALGCLLGAVHHFRLGRKKSAQSFFVLALASLSPAIVVTMIIFNGSTGNHHALSTLDPEVAKKIWLYALNGFTINPFGRMFGDDHVSWLEVVLYGSLKTGMIVWCLMTARRRGALVLPLLLTFLAFDGGNALLIAIGRYHTELRFSIGSRYQYEFLICIAPFLAIVFEDLCALITKRRRLAAVAVTSLWAVSLGFGWKATIEQWSGWHGVDGRRALLEMEAPPPGMTGTQLWLGIPPILSYEEAKAVAKEFHLH